MDRNRAQGKWEQMKGRLKEKAGDATGSDELRGEGVIDRMKGKAREKAGEAIDAAKRVIGRADRNMREKR